MIECVLMVSDGSVVRIELTAYYPEVKWLHATRGLLRFESSFVANGIHYYHEKKALIGGVLFPEDRFFTFAPRAIMVRPDEFPWTTGPDWLKI